MRRRSSYTETTPLLTLVATPIGNLKEVSVRVISALNDADLIGCEDTRVTGKLLSVLGVEGKALIKVEKHNEIEGANKLLQATKEGKKVAYVSDAGYPGLSDPGELIVKAYLEAGYNVTYVNGPNALLPALLGSGFDTDHFYFEGFLPRTKGDKKKRLEAIAPLPCTSVYYESPKRLSETLSDMLSVYGNRKACIVRELTKIHEEYIDGTLEELADFTSKEELKGECVIVIEGASETKKEYSDEEIKEALKTALASYRGKEAVEAVSKELGISKKRVYALYVALKG